VQQLWQEILGPKLILRSRLSRIHYRNRFFLYPLKPFNALLGVGPFEGLRIVASYLRWHFFPYREVKNFEQWVTNHFGKRLFEMFFRTYTEKVWGIPCSEIGAEWAAQRIRNLSLMRVVRAALGGSNSDSIRSLVEEFFYPERGPGQMWETLAGRLETMGHPVLKGRRVSQIFHDERAVTSVVTEGRHGTEQFHGKHFISSIPMRDLVRALRNVLLRLLRIRSSAANAVMDSEWFPMTKPLSSLSASPQSHFVPTLSWSPFLTKIEIDSEIA